MTDFEWNRILHGDVLSKIDEIPDNSIDCVVTSPPYYSLRDYGIEAQIWGDPANLSCEHFLNHSKNLLDLPKQSHDHIILIVMY